jgi:hypothetical protein
MPTMIDVEHSKCCDPGCGKRPKFNEPGVTSKGCRLLNITDKDGYCTTCHPDTFVIYKLAKQCKVVNWLSTDPNVSDYTSVDQVLDELLHCNTKKYRPDIVYEQPDGYTIIVEVSQRGPTLHGTI